MQLLLSNKEGIRLKLEEYKMINEVTGCWRSLTYLNNKGYASLRIEGKIYLVHRLSLYIFKDFDLKGELLALHKKECKFTDCWNPDHLYAGTHKNNTQDIIEVGNCAGMDNTHCKHGHLYNKKNTYITPTGYRQCRKCHSKRTSIFDKEKRKLNKEILIKQIGL